jgi:protocatechuate 3,4-dioxygenase beta subunit
MRSSSGSAALWICAALCAAAVAGLAYWSLHGSGANAPSASASDSSSQAGSTEFQPVPIDAADARELQQSPLEAMPSSESSSANGDEPHHVVVVVVDSEGKPIPGVLVEITEEAPLGSWQTDASGHCVLPLTPGPEAVVLRLSADGYVSHCEWQTRDPELEFELFRSVHVSGRVVSSESGAAIPGAQIEVMAMTGCRGDGPDAVTDGTGRFDLPSLPRDTDVAWVIYAEGFYPLEKQLELLEDTLDVELALERGLLLRFQVEDAQTGSAIPGATVGRGRAWVESDERGRAESTALASVGEGFAAISAGAPGYCDLHARIRLADLEAEECVRLRLLKGTRLEGRVLDAQGNPAPGHEVYLALDASKHEEARDGRTDPWLPTEWSVSPHSRGEVTSDEQGRFAFDGLAPDEGCYRLCVADDQGEMLEWVTAPPTGAPGSTTKTDLSVSALRFGVVVGTLTLNGKPAKGVVRWEGPTRNDTEQVAEDGTFRCDRVEPGTISVRPQPEGLVSSTCEGVFEGPWIVEVQPGIEARIDFALELDLARISGRVVDRSGTPRPNLTVSAYSQDGCWCAFDATDDEGGFELSVRSGPWNYQIRAGDYPDSVVREGVVAPTENLELALAGRGRLRLRVVDRASREPLTGYLWTLQDESGETRAMYEFSEEDLDPDPLGWYEQSLRPGPWKLCIGDSYGEVSGYLPLDGGTVLIPDGNQLAVLELQRERGHELEVRLAEGQPPLPIDVVVLLLETDRASQVTRAGDRLEAGPSFDGIDVLEARRIVPRAQNNARAVSLWGGPCRFVAFPDTIAIEPAEVVVTGHETAPVEIRWKPR